MDLLGHVNNTAYFRYFEQARIEWLYALQPAGEAFVGTGPVIVPLPDAVAAPLRDN